MDIVMVLLRLIHIIGGVFWAGTAIFVAGFVTPSVQALGEDGAKFMQQLTQRSRFLPYISAASGLTVLSGLIMYYRLFGWLAPLNTGSGLALTLGALAGLAGFAVAIVYQSRSSNRMAALGKEIAAGGGPPTPEQAAEVQALQSTLTKSGVWLAVLLTIAVIGMSLSEYFAI